MRKLVVLVYKMAYKIPSKVNDATNLTVAKLLEITEKLTSIFDERAVIFGGAAVWIMTGKPRYDTAEGERIKDIDVLVRSMSDVDRLRLDKIGSGERVNSEQHNVYYQLSPYENVTISCYSPLTQTFFDGIPQSVVFERALSMNVSSNGTIGEDGEGVSKSLRVVDVPLLVILKVNAYVLKMTDGEKDLKDIQRLLETHYGGSGIAFMNQEGELIGRILGRDSRTQVEEMDLKDVLRTFN